MRVLLAAMLALLMAVPAFAQNSREAERKLETIKRELQSVADERRKLEGARGDASKQLRAADEKVGLSNRTLRVTEKHLASTQSRLVQMQQRRTEMQSQLAGQREELARLLRAAYKQGNDAPLKVMLAQDRVADGQRMLTYHRYVQRDRAARIQAIATALSELDAVEREIVQQQSQLAITHTRQRSQLGQLQQDRQARARLVAEIDKKYQDRSAREAALGRDAKGLEQLLKKLRVAAVRAEAQRRAAAAKAEREAQRAVRAGSTARKPAMVASAPALQVGGLGWPISGTLLAGYGGTMPDGRSSDGLLIGANAGATVEAVADGTVVYAEWMTGYGLLLIVDHGNGYMSLYAHNDALLKDVGAAVRRGDAIGTVGNSGGLGRPALYFELRRNGQPVNPNAWLRQ